MWQGRKTKSFNERADLLSRYKLLPIRFNKTVTRYFIVIYANAKYRQNKIRFGYTYAFGCLNNITLSPVGRCFVNELKTLYNIIHYMRHYLSRLRLLSNNNNNDYLISRNNNKK